MRNYRSDLKQAGIKQVDLIETLKQYDIKTNPGELSHILSGSLCTPKAENVLRITRFVLNEQKGATNV